MQGMAERALRDADRLVLQAICASPHGELFGATKLQKILFIAHHPKQFSLKAPRPLRTFRFKVYHHGPFAEAVYASVSRLEKAGLIEVAERDIARAGGEPVSPDSADEDAPPLKVRVYRSSPDAAPEVIGADEADLALVKAAVKKWGWLTSEQIEQLVLIRTGLTPVLKARYAGLEWSAFLERAADELIPDRPEPPEAFWRAQQQFFRERARLLTMLGEGRYVAFIGKERVADGVDDVAVYEQVLATHRRPPDYMGFLSPSGRPTVDALTME